MENLNAEYIKVALKCHSDPKNKCEICPYNKKCCSMALSNDALALITSQEQRIEELTEENERLKKSEETSRFCALEALGVLTFGFANPEMEKYKKVIVADTVRKMQETLCEGRVSNDPVVIAVNVAAKEMLEDGNG